MRAHELDSLLLAALNDNEAYWPEAERYACLNEAARMLCLLQPEILVRRVLMSVAADEMFLDLRELAPDLLHLERVVVGDVSSHPPTPSTGSLRHLRPSHLAALRGHGRWLLQRREIPDFLVRFGLWWLITWPRSIMAHTLTLIYRASPAALTPTSPNAVLGISDTYAPMIVELAQVLAMAKIGSGEVQEGLKTLQRIFGRESFKGLPQPQRRSAA